MLAWLLVKEPFKGSWALPGGHLNTEDTSLEAAAQREAQAETGLVIPLDLFEQVYTFEDFQDPRGKYLCLLYVLPACSRFASRGSFMSM